MTSEILSEVIELPSFTPFETLVISNPFNYSLEVTVAFSEGGAVISNVNVGGEIKIRCGKTAPTILFNHVKPNTSAH